MKTKIIIVLISYIFLLSTNRSFSQLALNENDTNQAYLASLLINISSNKDTMGFNLNSVATTLKLQKSFTSYFGNNTENNWSKIGKYFLNRFHLNGSLTNALFTENGKLMYVITYGTEKDLPSDVRRTVKREYYDYTVEMAIEVKENDRDIWVVQLDNASKHITVRVEDGEMELVQQFKKSTI